MDIVDAVRNPVYLRLLLLTALVGIPIALVALLFEVAFEAGIQLIWYDLPTAMGLQYPPWWQLLLVPAIGGLAVAFIRRMPGDGGHDPLVGFASGITGPKALASVLLAGFVTLCCGAVLGHEAPLMALGTGLALLIGARQAAKGELHSTMFIVAGSAAALGALFGNPIVAAVLCMEGLSLGTLDKRPLILPALLSAGIGYVIFTGVGAWSGFNSPNLAVPTNPPGGTIGLADIGWLFVIAPVASLLLIGGRLISTRIDIVQFRSKLVWFIPAAGLLIGVLAISYHLVSGQDPRNVLYSGESQIGSLAATGYESSAGLLILLLIFKGGAYILSLGGGFRGGPIFPSIYFGGLIGTICGLILPGVSPLAAFYTAMAATTATSLRVPIGSILLVALVGGAASLSMLPLIIIAGVIGVLMRALADGSARLPKPPGHPRVTAKTG